MKAHEFIVEYTGSVTLPGRSGPMIYNSLEAAKAAANRVNASITKTKSGAFMLVPHKSDSIRDADSTKPKISKLEDDD